MSIRRYFHLAAVHPLALPPPPEHLTREEREEWDLLHVKHEQLDHIFTVQLHQPYNSAEDYAQAIEFWRNACPEDEERRDTKDPMATDIKRMLWDLIQRVQFLKIQSTLRAQYTAEGTALPLSPVLAPSPALNIDPHLAMPSPARPVLPDRAEDQIRLIRRHQHHHPPILPPPTAYPLNLPLFQAAWSLHPSQPHLPPYNTPHHPIFAFWARDLSRATILPEYATGVKCFSLDRRDLSDHGWGPGVRVHEDVKGAVAAAAREMEERVIK